MDLLESKEQHVSAHHWPSSGFILKVMLQECYTIIAIIAIIANYCKLLQLIANYCKLWQIICKLLQLIANYGK
jgi:hypothetical protein